MPWSWSIARPVLAAPCAALCAALCTALCAGLLAGPLGAATVVRKDVEVTIEAGRVRERTQLDVRLDTAGDLDSWSVYALALDTDRKLESFSAHTLLPDGRRLKAVGEDRVEYSGGSVLYGSQHFHVVRFPSLQIGARVVVVHEVSIEPYFPAGDVALRTDDAVESLRVTVVGGGPRLRWRLDGPAAGFTVTPIENGVSVEAARLAKLDPPDLAPAGAAVYPVLRYAWDETGSWQGVASWYRALLAPLARGGASVETLARTLTAGVSDPRARLEALLAHLRSKVRYVAIEVGIGGYRPAPPASVLERQWGDCKDKALLLIDLLHEVGIEAYPVLILAGEGLRIDEAFASPRQFNHLIVAVPAAAVAHDDDDPVAGGYLFVDPTQTRGGARWLQPADQDRTVLVVDGEGTLVRTPVRPRHESRRLTVDLRLDAGGGAVGDAGLQLSGEVAAGLIDAIESLPPARMEEAARGVFAAVLPGAELGRLGWKALEGEVPAVAMAAEVRIAGLVQGSAGRSSFQLVGLRVLPEPRLLDGRELPLVLAPRSVESSWQITLLEAGCGVQVEPSAIDNALGSFRQTLAPTGERAFLIERRLELRRSWVEPAELEALSALAIAEQRALQRRVRLECPAPAPAAAPAAGVRGVGSGP